MKTLKPLLSLAHDSSRLVIFEEDHANSSMVYLSQPGFYDPNIWKYPTINSIQFGSDGDDSFSGSDANNAIYGFDGSDSMVGLDGNDALYGGNGEDYLHGGYGDDWLIGDAGRDALWSGTGNDVLIGGAGDDILYLGSSNALIIMNSGDGFDRVWGFNAGDVVRMEGVTYSYSDFWGSYNKPVTIWNPFIDINNPWATRITTKDGREVILQGVKAEQLHGHIENGSYEWYIA